MELTKEKLEELYHNNTNLECCKILDISKTTFIAMIDKAGIERKGKGNPPKYNIVGV